MSKETNILNRLIHRRAEKYGDRTAVTQRMDDGSWRAYGWRELSALVDNVSYGFAAMGVVPGEHVGVFTANCAEVLIVDFAAYANRAVPVSIYATSSEGQVEYIVNDADIHVLFVGNRKQYDIARNVQRKCDKLKRIITIEGLKPEPGDTTSISYAQLLMAGPEATKDCIETVQRRTAAARPEDVATLIYTSGTTGEPKGAILPHSAFDAVMRIHHERLTMLSDADTSLCFLPLSHIFEKAWSYFCLYMGMVVNINPDPHIIQKAIKEVRPTCMCSVPRFWEKVYAAVDDKMSRTRGFKKWVFDAAISTGHRRNLDYVRLGKRPPALLELKYRFFADQVLKPMQRIVGVENGNIFPTAGAPLSAKITEFLHACGINIVIGYGLSETSATVCCFPNVGYEIGTIGTVMPEVAVKIGENNEILVKGPTVMRGYHNKPEATAEAFVDGGWFRTGDAGYIKESGAIVLTERIKDLFKTSNGKYVAPQALESSLGEDNMIEQVAIIGDQRKYVTAVIVPAFDALRKYADEHGIKYESNDDLVRNPEIRAMIEKRIEQRQKDFAHHEKIKKFTLLSKPFTMESGELTNTLKIRRPVINERYKDEIEAMYV